MEAKDIKVLATNDNGEFKWFNIFDYKYENEFITACKTLLGGNYTYIDWDNIPSELINEKFIDEELWQIDTDNVPNWEAFILFSKYYGIWDEEKFNDKYLGYWESESDFAEYFIEECSEIEIPGPLIGCIDYNAFARSIFVNDYLFLDGYVFYRR